MTDNSGFQLTGSAPELYEHYLAPIMAPFVEALLDATDVGPGSALLDLACGTGFAARAAAPRVGPDGSLTGVDVNPGMLVAARAGSASVRPPITWHQAPADHLPLPDGTFDVVVCQQGVQFFPDLDAAAAEAARVVRSGGRVAATAWLPFDRSPYFEAQFHAIEEATGPEAGASFAAAFACSPERIAEAFHRAGLHAIETSEVLAELHLPPLADFAPGHLAALPWGAAIAAADPQHGLESAAASIAKRLVAHTTPGGRTTVSFASALVTGTR